MQTFTLESYRFHYEHGGYGYRPAIETPEQGRVRCAISAARAEFAARIAGVTFYWTPDTDTDAECERFPGAQGVAEPPFYGCVMFSPDGTSAGSLWAIDGCEDRTAPYRRVIQAELALDAGYGERTIPVSVMGRI